jgi:DNA-binding transcriptional MerR regulator
MRIGELASQLRLSTKTIRLYESVGLLAEPERTPAGYRQYTQADAGRVTFIKTAQRLGMRLDEIREMLAFRDHGQPPCGHVCQVLRDQVTTIDQRIAELVRIREELATLDA